MDAFPTASCRSMLTVSVRMDTTPVVWVKPEIVCEVEYLEVTLNRHLRAPVFRRLRDEKRPEECTIDQLA